MDYFAVVVYCTMMFSLLVILVALWLSGAISGAYFDKKLQDQGLPQLVVFAAGFSSRCVRASIYLLLILLNGNPCIRHKLRWYPKFLVKRYCRVFGATDFRALARKRDWVLAIIIFGGYILLFITIIIMGVFPNS